MHRLILGSPEYSYPMQEILMHHEINVAQVKHLRVAMAYATYSGVSRLFDQLGQGCDPPPFTSEWIIGIHNGITEPRALTELLRKDRATALIFTPNRSVNR